jgi:transcriptional regulator with XRE-family HTH domain
MSTKFDSRQIIFNTGHSDISARATGYLPSSFGPLKKEVSLIQETLSEQPVNVSKRLDMELQRVHSNLMEKSFRRLSKSKRAREAFVKAELVNGLASQIRVLRKKRGWSQAELAKRLLTTQAVISRLEDPSYGKFSVKTLLDLGNIFDVGLLVRFVPYRTLIGMTSDTSESALNVINYDEESAQMLPENKESYESPKFVVLKWSRDIPDTLPQVVLNLSVGTDKTFYSVEDAVPKSVSLNSKGKLV